MVKFKLPFGGEIFLVLKIVKMGGMRHFRSRSKDPDSSADYTPLLTIRHCWRSSKEHCVTALSLLQSDFFCVSRIFLSTHCVTAGSLSHSLLRITCVKNRGIISWKRSADSRQEITYCYSWRLKWLKLARRILGFFFRRGRCVIKTKVTTTNSSVSKWNMELCNCILYIGKEL